MTKKLFATVFALVLTAQSAHALDVILVIPDLIAKDQVFQSTKGDSEYFNDEVNVEHSGWGTFWAIILFPFAILDEKSNSVKLPEQSLLDMGYQPAEIQTIAADFAKINARTGKGYANADEAKAALKGMDLAPVTREILDLR